MAEDRYDTETFDDVLTGDAGGAVFLECTFDNADLSGLRADRSRWSHCRLSEARADGLRLVEASWLDLDVEGCRFGVVDAPSSEWRRVRWTGGKLDFANLRAANLREVVLTDVEIGELDCTGATLDRVRLPGCRVRRLTLDGARLSKVDLTGAELEAVDGAAALRGASLTALQVQRLAGSFAHALGVVVAED